MVNDRGEPQLDNYTSVSPRGARRCGLYYNAIRVSFKSVRFQSPVCSKLSANFNITPNTFKIPDHSILICNVSLSAYDVSHSEQEDSQTLTQTESEFSRLNRNYNVDVVPLNIFQDDQCREQLNDVIRKLESAENIRDEIDSVYEEFVSTLHTEMDKHLRYRDINSEARKRKRHFGKPWWCDELNIL